jgi:hypothetical protein
MVFPIIFLIICGGIIAADIGIATLVGREPDTKAGENKRP